MDTQKEIESMVNAGMTQLTKNDFLNELNRLGYQVYKTNCFNYINGSNENTYKAKSIYIVENDSGLSFANIDARRDDNFKALQKMRFECFVYDSGRIWEL